MNPHLDAGTPVHPVAASGAQLFVPGVTQNKTVPLAGTPSDSTSGRRWLILPREHGAWGMVSLSFLAGVLVAPGDWLNIRTAAAMLAVFSVFLLRDPLVLCRIRRDPGRPEVANQRVKAMWSLSVCLGGLALSGGALLMTIPPAWVLLLGAAALALVIASVEIALERIQRQITFQMLSVAGLTGSCLPAYLAAHGSLDRMAFTVWALCAAHSFGAVLVVRARLETILLQRRPGTGTTSRRFYYGAVGWLTALGIALAVLASMGYPWVAVPFLLPSAMHVWELRQFRSGNGLQLSMRRVGWLQLGASVLFYSLLVALFRSQLLV